jgi:hypothetical protein
LSVTGELRFLFSREIVAEDFAPPMYSRNEFAKIVNDASNRKFSFLTINMKVGWDKRFRRNLDEFIVLDRLIYDDEDTKSKQKDYADIDKGQEGDVEESSDDGSDEQIETGDGPQSRIGEGSYRRN